MTVNIGDVMLVLGLAGAVGGIIYKGFRLYYRFRKLESGALHRKEDTEIMLSALLAILDGLKEQGCNGTVTTTREALKKYIIER